MCIKWILPIIFLCCSCSVKELANKQIVETIKASEKQVEASENFYLVEKAFPSILMMLDSAIIENAQDQALLIQGAKTNFIYAALFVEKDNEEWASLHYQQAKKYAENYFVQKYNFPLHWEKLDKENFDTRLNNLKKEDIAAIFWLTMSWGSWISLNRDDVTIISCVPYVENLMKKVISWDEYYENGMPHIFLANLNSFEKIDSNSFEKALSISKRTFFAVHVSYAELLGKFSQNRNLFEELLNEVITKWEKRSENTEWNNEFNLVNSISYNKAKSLIYDADDFYEDNEE